MQIFICAVYSDKYYLGVVMRLEDLFFIHVPKTGGRFIKVNFPEIKCSKKPLSGDYKQYETKYHTIFSTHATFNEISDIIDDTDVVFTSIRNPYSWLESHFYFEKYGLYHKKRRKEMTDIPNFETFILEEKFKIIPYKQYEYIEGIPKENILNTETLNEDLRIFFDRYEIDVEIPKEHYKPNSHKPDNIVWSDEMIAVVNNYYKDDFELLNYSKSIESRHPTQQYVT
jgi:hypothetical protein